MKTTSAVLVVGASLALACVVSAQVFTNGSLGALGDKVVTTNEVWDIPDNGQFHLNSLVVEAGATLTFRKPASGLNPPVYLLGRSNVTIHGTISVNGQHGALGAFLSDGGPGGFAGGIFGQSEANRLPGDGHGPGRGIVGAIPGSGSFGTRIPWVGPETGPVYGNALLIPLIGGSGGAASDGGPGATGGGGGGAVLVASCTEVSLTGRIEAKGGDFESTTGSGAGSGGAIRIVAPLLSGNGTLDVSGGNSLPHGGDGRVRIDCRPQPIPVAIVGWGRPERSVGRNPAIFPPNPPSLAILHAAGVDIAEGTNAAVVVTLPTGSPPEQMVTLQARNFTNSFTNYIDVTPENGPSARTSFVWNVGTNNLATTNIIVTIPGNTTNRITAWAEVSF